MTREALSKALLTLGVAFNREITRETCEVYWLALSDMPDEDLGEAATRALRECEFFPVPAKLRALRPRLAIDRARETVLRLEAMKPDPARLPTPEQFVELRRWGRQIRQLAGAAAARVDRLVSTAETAVSEDEKRAAIQRMEAQLAEWKSREVT